MQEILEKVNQYWCNSLAYLPLDKIAAILADIFKCIFLNDNDRILI